MSANEIKALKEKIKENKQKLRQLKNEVVYQELLLKQKKLRHYITVNKLPKREGRYLGYYGDLLVKELLLINIKFKKDFGLFRLGFLTIFLEKLYKVNDTHFCLKEEDILSLGSCVSEEDLIEKENYNVKLSEIFTEVKLIEIINRVEDAVKYDFTSFRAIIWTINCLFSVEERIKYFSPEVNFIADLTAFPHYNVTTNPLSFQTSLEIDPSLFYPQKFKDYINFLEGKIDPDLHTELYLTYCQ